MYFLTPTEKFMWEMEKTIRIFRDKCNDREGKAKRWDEERIALMKGLMMLRGKKYMVGG